MNSLFTRITAGALAAICILSAAACGEKKPAGEQSADNNTPVAGTEVPTVAPTEIPTEVPTEAPTPTPEPTATAIPWPTDPSGIIPKEVEIISFGSMPGHCISRVDGKLMFQLWDKQGLQRECEIPEEFAATKYIAGAFNARQNGDVSIRAFFTSNATGNFLFFYQGIQGRTLFFECTSDFVTDENLVLATTDGKVIWYQWGDDFYKMHDFGQGTKVKMDGTIHPIVNGEEIRIEWIDFKKIPF